VRGCSHTPNPPAGEPSFAGCPRLLIQYTASYPPYLEAFSSIRNLGTITSNAVLYRCEAWCPELWEEHRVRVFQNRVLRKIFELEIE
jgi:hypothetical protein